MTDLVLKGIIEDQAATVGKWPPAHPGPQEHANRNANPIVEHEPAV